MSDRKKEPGGTVDLKKRIGVVEGAEDKRAPEQPELGKVEPEKARAAEPPALPAEHVEREKLLDFELGRSHNAIGLTVLAITLMSAFMTYSGIMLDQTRDGGGALQIKLGVLGLSMALGLAIFVGNMAILRLAPLVRTPWLRILTFTGAIAFTGWVVGVSSWYSFTGISGPSAMAIYMAEETDKVAAAVDSVTGRASGAATALPALDAMAASACANQQAEVDSGLGTGSSGVGPFSMGLLSACTTARRVTDNLQTLAERSEQKAERLGAKLREIRQTVVNGEQPIIERERDFKAGMAEVDAMIRSLQNGGAITAVEASLATLENAVLELPTDNNAFGAKQQAMLAAIKDQMSASAQGLKTWLSDLKAVERVALERPGRISVTEVVLRYADRFIPNVLIAVGLDIYCLFMTGFLLIAGSGKAKARRKAKRAAQREEEDL